MQANQEHGILAQFEVSMPGVSDVTLHEVTPAEIILGESLLTPGLQTSVRVHSHIHSLPIKNLDDYKGSDLNISIKRECLKEFGIETDMEVRQRLYRLDNRRPIAQSVEEFTLHGCDQTLLNDAATLVSKLWKCTTPSAITSEVLRNCAGADRLDVESCAPARDYVAENIHPFQVVAQQANAGLAAGSDPSFVHYMTYENLGTHHFRSLYSLTRQSSIMTFRYSEIGGKAGYADPHTIMTYSFPCDFDLLSDILNGIDENGNDINSLMVYNPVLKAFGLFGNMSYGCGVGGGVMKHSMTNAGSAAQQLMCPDYVEQYLLKRQARMALLEQDKIALRLTVPWNPELHAGKIISLELINRHQEGGSNLNYGSGDYLIVHMKHHLKLGGFSTTVMDCVSKTVGQGGIV